MKFWIALLAILMATAAMAGEQLPAKWIATDGDVAWARVEIKGDLLMVYGPPDTAPPRWAMVTETVSHRVRWTLYAQWPGVGPLVVPPAGRVWVWDGDEWRYLRLRVGGVR